MSERVELVVYGNDAPAYDHGPEHPLRPARVSLTRSLITELGLLDGASVREIAARDASDEELLTVHTEHYVEAVRAAGHGREGEWYRYGLGPGDNPIFPMMHEASARVAGASLVAAEAVWTGRAEHAFNPSGGLHHAMPDRVRLRQLRMRRQQAHDACKSIGGIGNLRCFIVQLCATRIAQPGAPLTCGADSLHRAAAELCVFARDCGKEGKFDRRRPCVENQNCAHGLCFSPRISAASMGRRMRSRLHRSQIFESIRKRNQKVCSVQ